MTVAIIHQVVYLGGVAHNFLLLWLRLECQATSKYHVKGPRFILEQLQESAAVLNLDNLRCHRDAMVVSRIS
jgi:hypothetical protein